MFHKTPGNDLRSFLGFNPQWFIDWSLFFAGAPGKGKRMDVQRARRIGPSLAPPMADIPELHPASLALRNLRRGSSLGLPSGQSIARVMGIDPIKDNKLTVGPNKKPLTDVSDEFRGNAPLWYYILAEADLMGEGKLGPVGGRIVMETFIGLLLHDTHSFLRQDLLWKPEEPYGTAFGVSDLIKVALG